MIQVQQIMARNVWTCGPDDTLECPARVMWEYDVGVVPVVNEVGRVAGIVTDRDLCMAAYTQGRALSEIRVRVVMAAPVVTVRPTDTLEVAESVLRDYQIRRVPVVDEQERVVGMLSQNDLVREAARERRNRKRDVTADEVVTTLAMVGRSRAGELAVAE